MRHKDIVIGHVYAAKISGKLAPVRVTLTVCRPAYGTYASYINHAPRVIRKFMGVNERTGRTVGPYTAAKFRFEVEEITKDHWWRIAVGK